MSLCGACPGMVLPQVGAGVGNSLVTLLGALAGAGAYNFGSKFIFKKENSSATQERNAEGVKAAMQQEYLDLRFDISLHKMLVGFGILCACFGLVLEYLIPYKSELMKHGDFEQWHDDAWPPSLCGFGIGMLNLIAIRTVNQTIGSATGYANLMGYWSYAPLPVSTTPGDSDGVTLLQRSEESTPDTKTRFLHSYWQIPYLICAVFGAHLSAEMSQNYPSKAYPIRTLYEAFLGGFLMLFGSRMGGGCTSGHGIAGMPMMNVFSILGCMCMFAGGIATGILMHV